MNNKDEILKELGWEYELGDDYDDGHWVYGIDDHWELTESTAEILSGQILALKKKWENAAKLTQAVQDLEMMESSDYDYAINDMRQEVARLNKLANGDK